jgi:SecD/SecF fusion protein
MKRFSIIKRSYVWLFIWGCVLVGSWILFFMNIRYSEEFTGWVKLTVQWVLDETQITTNLTNFLNNQWYTNNKIITKVTDNETVISIVTSVWNDEKVGTLSQDTQKFLLDGKYITSTEQIIQQSITWPSVWDYMKTTAVKALIIWLIFMVIYMMFAFATIRKSMSPSVLAFITIVTMIFDVSIPAWAYGILMMFNHSIAVDTVFIIAILTNMGYSINDTIIIFDRIRENLQNKWHQKWMLYGQIFEDSLWQTMRRSIWTVTSTLLVIVFMYILWGWIIKNFAFTIW